MCIACITSSSELNLCLWRLFFKVGNNQKLHGARSGEQDRCGITRILFALRYTVMILVVCGLVLSWCRWWKFFNSGHFRLTWRWRVFRTSPLRSKAPDTGKWWGSLSRKKWYHDLARGFLLENFLCVYFIFPFPELVLSFGQRVEVLHSCFIRGYDAIEVVWMVSCHPQKLQSALNVSVHLFYSLHMGYPSWAHSPHLELLRRNPVNGYSWEMDFILKLSDWHISILVNDSSHGIDVHFCNVICEQGWPVGFACTGTALGFSQKLRAFSTLSIWSNIRPHMFPLDWRVFRSSFYHDECNILSQHVAQHNAHVFHWKKNEKKYIFQNWTSTSICCKMRAVQHSLFVAGSNDAYVSPLSTSMVHNSPSGHYTHLGHSYITE